MVAGIIGSNTYGVAERVTLVPVRVLDCTGSGTTASVVAGINWAVLNHLNYYNGLPAVMNLSLGGAQSTALDAAVKYATDNGIIVTVAAGNSSQDACRFSPARAPKAITVGASTRLDAVAPYSNIGSCVDLFAPGVQVTVADVAGEYVKADGTSISAGFVSGAAAALMSVANSVQTPETVLNLLLEDSTKGVLLVDNSKFSSNQNRMIHLVDGNGEIANYGDLDFYMGVFNDTIETMDGDINNLAFGSSTDIFGNSATYSLIWDNEDIKTKYEQYISLDAETGVFNITKPMEELPEGQTLEIVKFKFKQTSTVGEALSPNLFFFATDPSRDASYDYNTDIASALENINSQSYFAAWRGAHIK